MIALSIRQPWAWLIVHAGKDIENRTWATRCRGPFLVHASLGMTRREYEDVQRYLSYGEVRPKGIHLPPFEDLERGGIIGQATIVDCVTASESPWFMGTHGFVLRDAKPLPFVPFKGRLGFFEVPDHLLEK